MFELWGFYPSLFIQRYELSYVFQKICFYSVHISIQSSKDVLLIISYFVFQNLTVQISSRNIIAYYKTACLKRDDLPILVSELKKRTYPAWPHSIYA